MPRIKRWFPVNQYFLEDPELLSLRFEFGDWAALVWLALLSAADRNDGIVKGPIHALAEVIARQTNCRWNPKWHAKKIADVEAIFDKMQRMGWIAIRDGSEAVQRAFREPSETLLRWLKDASMDDQRPFKGLSEGFLEVSKYWKYHKTREPEKIPLGKQSGSLLSEPSEPSLPKEALKSQEPLKNRIAKAIGSMSNGDGKKAKALQAWITSKRDLIVSDPDGLELVAQTLERLKQRESNGTEVKSYDRYLDTLYAKVKIEWNQSEAARLNNQRKEVH